MSNLQGESEFESQSVIVDLVNALSAIKELSAVNYQEDTEKGLIKKALSILVANQDMEFCSFFLLNANEELVNVVGASLTDPIKKTPVDYKPLKFKIGEGLVGLAAQTGEVQQSQDCSKDKRFITELQKKSNLFKGSIISVPVFSADESLLGVLNISHSLPQYFRDRHLHLLEIYKNMLSQLISNFRMFKNMESQISTRTIKLEAALVNIEQLKEHYKEMSMIDSLTGLYNRRYFFDQVGYAIANSKRYGYSLCLLMLDLDYFKEANDVYGHGFGDQVLKKVASALQTEVRGTDILARYGGEEFVVIYTNTDCAHGCSSAERIRVRIENLSWEGKENYSQTVSIGLCCLDAKKNITNEIIDIDNLICNADTALYQAKGQGRNKIVVFDDENKKLPT